MPLVPENVARTYAKDAGFSGDKLEIVIAIAKAESGLDSHPKDNQNSDGSHDRGILQFNSFAHREVSDGCAYDPACSFHEAYRVSNQGNDFSPWTTYTHGDYLRYYKSTPGGSGVFSVEQVRQSMVPKYTWFAGWLGPGTRAEGGHAGEDLGKAKGSKAYFPESGSIYFPNGDANLGHYDSSGGNVVYFAGDSGLYWYFAHLLRPHTFPEHNRVAKGSVIGLIDNSGDAATKLSHLHYQVGIAGNWDDPAHVLVDGIPGGGINNTGTGTGPGYITLYDDRNYQGNSVVIHSDDEGYYLSKVPKNSNGDTDWNNRALSINVPSGTTVRLYENLAQASGQYKGGTVLDTSISIADLSIPLPKGLSSLKYVKLGTGGGGFGGIGGNVGNILGYLGQHYFINSLAADVHTAISTIPGFSGMVLAVDEAEEVPGWIDHGTSGAADIIRSVSDSIFSNAMGIGVRFLITFLGVVLMIGLLMNLVKATTGASTQDIAMAATL